MTSVGNFESVHDLWAQFQDVVARGSYDEAVRSTSSSSPFPALARQPSSRSRADSLSAAQVRQPDPILKSSRAHDEPHSSPERRGELPVDEE